MEGTPEAHPRPARRREEPTQNTSGPVVPIARHQGGMVRRRRQVISLPRVRAKVTWNGPAPVPRGGPQTRIGAPSRPSAVRQRSTREWWRVQGPAPFLP